MNTTTIGIDIAKNLFQVYGVDAKGRKMLSKRLSRQKLLPFFTDLKPCVIGLEACGSSNYWSRRLSALGHENVMGFKFWSRGYCVSTVELEEEVIRAYIRNQESGRKG